MAGLGRLALAAIGILAYKNRDKLGEFMNNMSKSADPSNAQATGGSLFEQALKGGGLGDLLSRFRAAGASSAVDSWVSKGSNEPIQPRNVEAALDEHTLEAIARQTGLSRQDIVERLAVAMPGVVDEMTPDGTLSAVDVSNDSTTLLDPVPPASHKMSGAAQPDWGISKSTVADRDIDGPRQDGASPRSTDDPII